jgi:hypothetical protein
LFRRAIDHRLYVPKLMADFEARGGLVEVKAIDTSDLAQLAQRFDLLVVSSGRGMLGQAMDRRRWYRVRYHPQLAVESGILVCRFSQSPPSCLLNLH